jgi:hypothetical protein
MAELEITIGYAIMSKVAEQLRADLIDSVTDTAVVGVVIEGPLFDTPTDYEEARITIELYENDPFSFDSWDWVDEPIEDMLEIGYGITWRRRFTLMARILLVNTAEDRSSARMIASAIKSRIENSLIKIDFSGIEKNSERVSGRIFSENIRSKILQSGGPESWDYEFQVRFEVKTTKVY